MTGFSEQWNDNEVAELKKIFYARPTRSSRSCRKRCSGLRPMAGDEDVAQDGEALHPYPQGRRQFRGPCCRRARSATGSRTCWHGSLGTDKGADHEGLEILSCGRRRHSPAAFGKRNGKDIGWGTRDHRPHRPLLWTGIRRARLPACSRRPTAALTEYQELQIQDAVQKGLRVYDVEASVPSRVRGTKRRRPDAAPPA